MTAPRELMCTWQEIERECHELKHCAHTCAILWHCGLGSFVVREEWMLKRKQTKKKSHMCCTPNVLEVLIYNILDCQPEL